MKNRKKKLKQFLKKHGFRNPDVLAKVLAHTPLASHTLLELLRQDCVRMKLVQVALNFSRMSWDLFEVIILEGAQSF